MSRSGYSDDYDDPLALGRWRGMVASAIRGARGQALLREALAALDAMPVKELVARSFAADGQFCMLGVVGARRGVDMTKLEQMAQEDADCEYSGSDIPDVAADVFDISRVLAAEIMYANDESIGGLLHKEMELCGPIRPFRPHWESRIVRWSEPDPTADARRWVYMRGWIAERIRKPA